MTPEERFDRIEHVTAGIAEQARRDREENRDLWRQTQRQLDELAGDVQQVSAAVGVLAKQIDRLVIESATRDQESRKRDRELGERVNALVSAIGEWIRSKP